MMKTGARFRFFVPPALAYKEYGNPPLIGANAVLIYEAELVTVEK
ncbi:FKBP-type peptidyl-prolyl cis-trans isomerase [Acidobacteriota bacterium]